MTVIALPAWWFRGLPSVLHRTPSGLYVPGARWV